jgi:NAD(P)-dependent dehydrogenase (short-subunit alcohol dehydrogenase family)
VDSRGQGEAWLVLSGASSQLGQAVARLWRREGGRVAGLTRAPDLADIDVVLTADLFRPGEAAARLEGWLRRSTVRPRALVHAAGLAFAAPAETTTGDEWQRTLQVNLEAGFWLARTVAAAMADAGALVMVSSIDSRLSSGDGPAAAYGAAKAGVEGLVRHLAVEWGPRGIRVNAVRLGPLTAGMEMTDAVRESLAGRAADGKLTTPLEAAEVIHWLLGSGSRAVTGQCFTVDHGFGLRY